MFNFYNPGNSTKQRGSGYSTGYSTGYGIGYGTGYGSDTRNYGYGTDQRCTGYGSDTKNHGNPSDFGAYVNSFSGYGYPSGWYGGGIKRSILKSFYETCGTNNSGYPICCRCR